MVGTTSSSCPASLLQAFLGTFSGFLKEHQSPTTQPAYNRSKHNSASLNQIEQTEQEVGKYQDNKKNIFPSSSLYSLNI